ncbi:hypothetical protein MTR67_042364 [Solanum verrucosum]|uniref:Uncharacterized protein n=1 Tax=Solanum verrucosum TaxID=315347 RepID=A0AAF0ZU18_SOLVR|nr:hypothetical protein MTR67_042364 [Solanum verrucosum]
MALKVILVLFFAMLLFTNENNGEMIKGEDGECLARCIAGCLLNPICTTLVCPGYCSEKVQTQNNRICNVGCSFGHCYKYLINNYDHEKFGSCMTSCNENYCVDGNNNIALPKA